MNTDLTALIKYRTEQAHDTMQEAEILFEKHALRGTINRAYYAMFYCAEALLFSKDLTFSKHSAVIAFFGKEFVKSGIFSKDIYSHLTDGFSERQICDYDAMIMPKAEDAERIINGAKIFIEATCVYLKGIGYEIGMSSH